MKAYINSYSSWNYLNAIEIHVDKEMLEMISNQLRIEIVKAIEAHDDGKAYKLLGEKIDIDNKLDGYAEKVAEENAERETEE